MAWIEMNADLRRTNELLERLVKVAERLLSEEYGIRYGHTLEKPVDSNPVEKESVSYATDEETIKRRLKEIEMVGDQYGYVFYPKEEG